MGSGCVCGGLASEFNPNRLSVNTKRAALGQLNVASDLLANYHQSIYNLRPNGSKCSQSTSAVRDNETNLGQCTRINSMQ